jgi:hypothetical protein
MKIEKCKWFYNQWVVWNEKDHVGHTSCICIVKIDPKNHKPSIDIRYDYLTLEDLQELVKLIEGTCKELTNELHKPT